jgi:hypothetical protein
MHSIGPSQAGAGCEHADAFACRKSRGAGVDFAAKTFVLVTNRTQQPAGAAAKIQHPTAGRQVSKKFHRRKFGGVQTWGLPFPEINALVVIVQLSGGQNRGFVVESTIGAAADGVRRLNKSFAAGVFGNSA